MSDEPVCGRAGVPTASPSTSLDSHVIPALRCTWLSTGRGGADVGGSRERLDLPPLLLRSRMRWQSLPVLIDVSESSPQPDTTAESSRNRDDTCGDCCRSGWCDVIAAVNAPLTAVASALGAAGSPVTSPELRDLPLPFVGKQHPGTVPAKRAVHETVRVQGVSHTDFDGGSGPGWPPSYLVARVVISAVVRAWS